MIVTVTPNPSFDRTLEVGRLLRGTVVRASGFRLEPAGKGVNVSRALASNGIDTVAVLPCGRADMEFIDLLSQEGVETSVVTISGRIRHNVSIVEPEGVVTRINQIGPVMDEVEMRALRDAVKLLSDRAAWFCGSGTLPPGIDGAFYGDLMELVNGDTHVAVDTSGEPLLLAARAGVRVVKPNLDELSEAVGRDLDTVGDALDACAFLLDIGAEQVLASLGKDGAVLVTRDGALHGEIEVPQVISTVGAGDALLAGFLSKGGDGVLALSEGLSWAAAKIVLPGSRMPTPREIGRSVVKINGTVDRGRSLRER